MNSKELEIYKEAIKKKYKYHNVWKALAIIFICLTILFATLYFTSGEVFKETVTNSDVEIINNGDGNNKNNVIIGSNGIYNIS